MTPQRRQLVVVRDHEMNRTNDFWRPLIGKVGVISDVNPDGLVDVVVLQRQDDMTHVAAVRELSRLLTHFDMGGCTFSLGAKPERFDLGYVIPEPLPEPIVRRRWWQFWKRT